jgi:DNA-binding transcriptional regulator YdaS (Cro superfamily)
MKLSAYLGIEGRTAKALADLIGVPTSTVTRLARGERSPGLLLASKIERATGGEVTLADLTPQPDDFIPPALGEKQNEAMS